MRRAVRRVWDVGRVAGSVGWRRGGRGMVGRVGGGGGLEREGGLMAGGGLVGV